MAGLQRDLFAPEIIYKKHIATLTLKELMTLEK